MPQSFPWPIETASPAQSLRRRAVVQLADMFPRPYNFASSLGFGLRKMRLGNELAEYDFLHRSRLCAPASFEELVCAGRILIEASPDRFPSQVLPLDEPLLVNPDSFDDLSRQVALNLVIPTISTKRSKSE